ncbi:MAG TPA: hypothetical protein ENN49_11315 [Bacteroidales bacterium]|nr:hypothetical protein [Bacteroidales bacterium]
MKKITLSNDEIEDLKDLYQSEIDRAQRRIDSLKSILRKIEKGDLGDEKEVAAPKKRGRKPKAKEVAEPTTPKKRGRPKKITAEANKSAQTGEPKKRGRKPKENSETKAEKPKKEPQKVTMKKVKTSPPKKRGRKPKSLRKRLKPTIEDEKIKWNDLIIDIFKSNDKLLQAKDLTMRVLEKLQLPEVEKDRTRMAVATNLTKLTKYEKKIFKYARPDHKIAYYGLAEWFNEDGTLKPEYQNKF